MGKLVVGGEGVNMAGDSCIIKNGVFFGILWLTLSKNCRNVEDINHKIKQFNMVIG